MKCEFSELEHHRDQHTLERRRYSRRSTDYPPDYGPHFFLALERLGRHVILLNDKQSILYQSRHIGELIHNHQLPLRLQPHFHLNTPKHSRQFQAFLESIKTSRAKGSGQSTESFNLLLSSSSDERLRLKGFALDPQADEEIKIVILLSNPAHISALQWQAFRNAYQLTGAELRLAAALADGLSLDACSQKYRVSIHTARSQLKSIFAKTDTRRQSDLVRLIFLETSP